MKSLHCLSAFCPPASQIKSDDRLWRMRVSIAFRRSAPRLPKQNAWSVSRSGGVSIAFRRSAPRLPGECTAENIRELFSLHCLSAFCPPASLHRQAKRSFSPARSPLPFGVLPPGFEGDKLWAEGDKLWVSIAFRRSAPRLPGGILRLDQSAGVSIAFRRSAPRLHRPLNPLAGRVARAVQVTTAGAGQFGSRWRLAFRGVKLHKVLRFGELKLRSGPPRYSGLSGPDLEPCGLRIGGFMQAVVAGL